MGNYIWGASVFALLVCFGLTGGAYGQEVNQEKANVIKGKRVRVTPPLPDAAKNKLIKEVTTRNENGAIWPNGIRPQKMTVELDSSTHFSDPDTQNYQLDDPSHPTAVINTVFNGIGFRNINPPDPSIAVGPAHVLQMINGTSGSLFRITSKTGAELLAPTFLDQVTGLGGFADPIALYDEMADRFIMMEMVNAAEVGSYGLSIAISQTGNPMGNWNAYFFTTGNNLPDYPKIAIWPDGYYITANEFTNASSYAGTFVYAINRPEMLQGLAEPIMVRTRFGVHARNSGACPVTLQGIPAAGANVPAGLIAWIQDDVWTTWNAADTDSIGLTRFVVNWNNPESSHFTQDASLAVGAFKSNVCTAGRGRCIPQTGTSVMLEALHQKVMNQPVYRIFENFEGIVMTHTTDVGNEQAGIRWYELRRNRGGRDWNLAQESTWSPDETHRFMPSITYNFRGDIALIYNVSDANGTHPGIRFTGRNNCDPAGLMTFPEMNIAVGNNISSNARFGDYSHLVSDPVDGGFWVTGQFMPSTSWGTAISKFSFGACTPSCPAPNALKVENLTSTTALLGWGLNENQMGYVISFRATADPDWIQDTLSVETYSMENLNPGASYQFRVQHFCPFGKSEWSNLTFSTPPQVCNYPTGLLADQITASSVVLKWDVLPDVAQYLLKYKKSNDLAWIELRVEDTTVAVTGLDANTLYNWEVQAICNFGQSEPIAEYFTTGFPPCLPPVSLATSEITSGSAQLQWQPNGETVSYNLEFQKAGANVWTVLSTNISQPTWFLTGLTANTAYTWRVSAHCPSSSSSYTAANFTTTGTCATPGSPRSASITSTEATVSWSSVRSVQGYRVEYKEATATQWIPGPNITTTSFRITGLIAGRAYHWRVRTRCTVGNSVPTVIQNFTTLPPPCPDIYEPNNSDKAPAALIPGMEISASIATGSDQDWFTFSNTTANPNMRVSLTNLPANYTLTLHNSSGREVAKSSKSGLSDEYIAFNTNVVGKWMVRVVGSSSAFNAGKCYRLLVQIQSGTGNSPEMIVLGTATKEQQQEQADLKKGNNEPNTGKKISASKGLLPEATKGGGLKLYPNPVQNRLFYQYESLDVAEAIVTVSEASGRVCLQQKVMDIKGINKHTIETGQLNEGIYVLIVKKGNRILTAKFMVISK